MLRRFLRNPFYNYKADIVILCETQSFQDLFIKATDY